MATRRSQKQISAIKNSRRYRDRLRETKRKMNFESLEDRRVMATTGPTLVNVLSNFGPIADNSTVSVAPREITLRFAEGQQIDPSTIAGGVRVIRSGLDDTFDNGNDVVITPGWIGLSDTPREIVMRFASNLPDDIYRIELIGTGDTPLRDAQGNPVNGGADKLYSFNLDLGAQITAVVPQPVRRLPNGKLDADPIRLRQIEVYFNNDLMNLQSVQNRAFYKLINTSDGSVSLPQTVVFSTDPLGQQKALLTFASDIPTGTFKLKVGTSDETNDTISTAIHVGGPVSPTTHHDFASLFLGDNPNLIGSAVNDVDLFRFDVAAATSFTVTVGARPGFNPALRLFTNTGLELDTNGAGAGNATDANGVGLAETFTIDLTPGVYYLGVSSSGNVSYNPLTGDGRTGGTSTGSYTLTVNFNNTIPTDTGGNDSSFDTANDAGVLGLAGAAVISMIEPRGYTITFPGNGDDPGHRKLPLPPTGETHLLGPVDPEQGIQTVYYNFRDVYGTTPQGNPLHNAITENQKQRAREIFELYGRYLGVKFVETDAAGITVVTGDMRAIDPNIPTGPGGVAGLAEVGGRAIMDNAENWGNSEYGGGWFTTAMHEIGHALGLGHSYDLPELTIQGSAETPDTTPGASNGAEPVFPGDHDIIHGQTLYRPEIYDIDLYKFRLTEAGRFSAETLAERLANSSLLNSVISLYREVIVNGQPVRELIAQNDDYFSSDSFLELDLTAGTYYIGVMASGMSGVNPNVLDSGFGATSQGVYQLKMNFKPFGGSSIVDADTPSQPATPIDGDLDGVAGGAYEFFFKSGPTIFVDKANDITSGADGNGSLTNPYDSIADALEFARNNPGLIVRIVGNGGTDNNMTTLADNRPYLIGYDHLSEPLADGVDFLVPRDTTVVIDAGAVLKFQRANIDVGSSTLNVDRSGGALQVLGTPALNVQMTSYNNDAIGGNSNGPFGNLNPGDWGGIVFRDTSDLEGQNIFLNFVNNATLTYGGGKVVVDSVEQVFTPIHMVKARPTLTFNRITNSADAAISADPDSFEDVISANGAIGGAASRIGPDIYGNTVIANSINGLFIRIRTEFGNPVDVLNVTARFDDTDIVHVITENLHINGTPGGPKLNSSTGTLDARLDARLRVDPGVIVKLEGSRIEARVGAQLIAEGDDFQQVIFTAQKDDRFGAGGTFDTSNDGLSSAPAPGAWGGFMFNANSKGSIDRASVFYGGGVTPIEGSFASFNVVEIHQADVRIAKSLFQFNAAGTGPGGDRNGRGSNGAATIFVRGAQPIIVDNIIRDNGGNIISINANAMQATVNPDWGRSTAIPGSTFTADSYMTLADNYGPLVRLNRIVNNGTNGMEVRGAVLTTESIWDDTDIAHVLRDQITILNQHVYGGLRLQSSPSESLVVKLQGANAGFHASGVAIDITDRIGGTLHIIGQPNRPVVLTSLADDSVPAGLQPITDLPLFDTNNDGSNSTPQPGDWNSILLDKYSNDRNVAIIMETEPAFIGAANAANGRPLGDQNRIANTTAQFLGNLAPHEKAGDDNRRLGFEVQGFIALDNPHDVDVYSFTADGGTEIWIDLDRTGYGLNAMVELVDANGNMIARSRNNDDPSTLNPSDVGSALYWNKDPFLGRDFYTTNPNDAFMRVILPGAAKGAKYFVRVRSEGPGDANNVNVGKTSGEYRLQIRIRQVDNKPGSTVRFADIRYATNGIEVIGLPYHSNIGAESSESTADNNTLAQAQQLGNLLTSDRSTISVGGSLSSAADVDFYSFDLDFDFLQVITGRSDAFKTVAAMFDIDYADGLSRPDTTISVFDADGRLIFIGRDSDIEDDQPGAGQGVDSDDLSRGSFGKLDPYIGSAQLPAGSVGANLNRRYYVAISSNRRLPTALNAQFQANAASPLIRLEPITSVRRIVEDHIGSQNGSNLAEGAASPMFNTTNVQTLATHIQQFTLADTVLFTTGGTGLRQVNGYTGQTEVGNYTNNFDNIGDLVMRNDGRLFAYRFVPNNNTTAGQLLELDPTTNTWVSRGNDGIADPPQGNTDIDLIGASNVGALAFTGNGFDNNYQLYFAVTTNAALGGQVSYLYRADPNTGNVRDGNGPLGRRLNPITSATSSTGTANFGVSQVDFVSNTAGAVGDNIQIVITQSDRGPGATPFVDVVGTTINIDLNTAVSTAQAGLTVGSVSFQFVADNPGAAGNTISLNITKQANVAGGASVSVTGRTINVILDNANVTAQQLLTALNNNPQAAALINASFSGDPLANIGPGAPVGSIPLVGGGPSSAQDVVNAVLNNTAASNLVSVSARGDTTASITANVAQTFNLSGGTGAISATTGMAWLNGTMYGVSANGNFYRIDLGSGSATHIATVPGVNFTGLTVGPQNADYGAYSNLLFATTADGRIMALNTAGVPQPIFAPTLAEPLGATSINTAGSTGLAFSPIDFNMWHTTLFRRGEAGHGINAAPDNSRGATEGGLSMYFGLEEWVSGSNNVRYTSDGGVNGGVNAQLGIMEQNYHRNLTSNPNIGNNYNVLGHARGSLVTDSFSLQGYKSTDKPTFYFNYWLETEDRNANNGNMRDSARVWISRDDGVTWELIATNNSVLDNPGTLTVDGELSTFKSTSTTELPFYERQVVQELYDVASWRQARIDLSNYAGEANLKFRFDFSTSGATGTPGGAFEDGFGNFSSPERSANNNFGGFMIDDLIVGFAERGEMATGASPNLSDFFAPPVPVAPPHYGTAPNEVLAGHYQLEIRRGIDYGVNTDGASANIGLYGMYDTNERLVQDTRESAPPPVDDFQSGTFTLPFVHHDDAPWTIVEDPAGSGEFQAQSGGVLDNQTSTLELTIDASGAISFDAGVSAAVGDALVFSIDGAPVLTLTGDSPLTTYTFPITPGVHTYRWSYIKDGSGFSGLDRAFLDNVVFSNGPQVGVGGIGDENHWRDQGHIQIEQNLITDSLNVGILVDNGPREGDNGDLPFPGSAMRMFVINNQRLVPGVTLMNNVIGGYGAAGIRFSGDPNLANQAEAATPFGRVINNTVYGGATPTGIGIEVTNNAGPTILNNIVSNAATGIAIDASSAPNTVVGANLFKGNTANGVLGTDAIQLGVDDPLFVNPENRNFYLAAGSRAIDSSLNSLGDRPNFIAVRRELGIPDSPILAPEVDLYGQVRLDDFTQNPPPGLGTNIFKDRGGIERADFLGPTASLIEPQDNDGDGRDRNGALNDVVVRDPQPRFVIKLSDQGIGIDDPAVLASQFTLTQDGLPLVLGTDYSFIYNPNTDEVTLLPASGTFNEAVYEITIDNTDETGVKDVAGNPLQPNREDGTTRFTIAIGVPFDYSDAPESYPVARHELSNELFLGANVSAEAGPVFDDSDVFDDGFNPSASYLLDPGAVSHIDVVSSGVGKLDIWIDLDHDGTFTDDERISPSEFQLSFDVVAGVNPLSFELPEGALGQTIMRLRLSTDGVLDAFSDAPDGEVEDYVVTLSGPPFQNPFGLNEDVDADGVITPLDALIVINYLNFGVTTLPDPLLPDPANPFPRYVDVDGDGVLTPTDALIVINWLNDPANQEVPDGEGESLAEGEAAPAVLAAATTDTTVAGTTIYASSSIVVEEKPAEIDPGEVAALLFSDAPIYQAPPAEGESPWSSDELFSALGDDEDDILSELAFDFELNGNLG